MSLSIAQNFLLLAQHPTKGRFIIEGLHLQYGIVGSVLLEMALSQKVEINENKLVLKSTRTDTDSIIADMEMQIKKSTKSRKIRYWLSKLGRRSKKYKRILLDELEQKRIIRIEQKSFLGIIPYRLHFLRDQGKRNEMIKRLKRETLSQSAEITNEDVILLSLIAACKMYKVLSTDRQELKTIKKRLKQIIAESPIAASVSQTINEVQAAILVSIMASTVVTTASSH